MKTAILAVAILVLGASLHRAGRIDAAGVGPEQDQWNVQAAASYLDARMDLWFANATKLTTGSGRTACVSCHTPIPYALARPALRRIMHASRPTSQELTLAENATRRVETYASHELLYAFDDDKRGESRGTEAVLNALILASARSASNDQRPPAPVREAFAQLWDTQRADGAWDWLDFGLEPFESAESMYQGATLAAWAVGLEFRGRVGSDPSAREHIDRLRGYLVRQYGSQNLYNQAWALLASTHLTRLLTNAQRATLVAELGRRQHRDGGWSLHDLGLWRWSRAKEPYGPPANLDTALVEQSDGYATGLIVYALRQSGTRADDPVVKQGLQWLRTNQQAIRAGDRVWFAWRAHSMNYDREHGGDKGEPWRRLFMSDAATAFAVLALSSTR